MKILFEKYKKKLKELKEKKDKDPKVTFYEIIWVFVIGCTIGCIAEMVWAFLAEGFIMTRKGVIYGPFIPVYGFGAILFVLFYQNIRNANFFTLFIVFMIVGGGFEYICSVVQEYLTGTVSWDYSNSPFNLNGRTNLTYSVIWGIMGATFLKYIYPFVDELIKFIHKKTGNVLTILVLVFMILDMGVSILAVRRQIERKNGEPPDNSFELFLDDKYTDEFLKEIYPNMIIVD